mgnify:CR=1 FL=1
MTVTWDPGLVSDELLELTRSLGDPSRNLVMLAEGNTSQRLADNRLVVMASGVRLSAAGRDDFVALDLDEMTTILEDPAADEASVSRALGAGCSGGVRRRASIESLMHSAVQAVAPVAFIAHTHPTDVLGLLSSIHAATAFESSVDVGEAVAIGRPLFIPYVPPGLHLGRTVLQALRRRADETGEVPPLILLGNHGIVAIGATAAAVGDVTHMAVRAARVRTAALSVGGVLPLPAQSSHALRARDDFAARRLSTEGTAGA